MPGRQRAAVELQAPMPRKDTRTLPPMNRAGTESCTIRTVIIEERFTLGFSRPRLNSSAGSGGRNGASAPSCTGNWTLGAFAQVRHGAPPEMGH
jgi:hypothetical protein